MLIQEGNYHHNVDYYHDDENEIRYYYYYYNFHPCQSDFFYHCQSDFFYHCQNDYYYYFHEMDCDNHYCLICYAFQILPCLPYDLFWMEVVVQPPRVQQKLLYMAINYFYVDNLDLDFFVVEPW